MAMRQADPTYLRLPSNTHSRRNSEDELNRKSISSDTDESIPRKHTSLEPLQPSLPKLTHSPTPHPTTHYKSELQNSFPAIDIDLKKNWKPITIAWTIIINALEKRGEKDLKQFWDDVVVRSMFAATSSPERKSLALQIVSQSIRKVGSEIR